MEVSASIYLNNQKFKDKLAEYTHFSSVNPLLDYIESITYDIREARVLVEAIESREVFLEKKAGFQAAGRESKEELEKLQSGRMSIRSLFTEGTKEAQKKELESYIPKYEDNAALLEKCLPLSAVSIHRDIELFKKSRTIDFLGAFSVIAQK